MIRRLLILVAILAGFFDLQAVVRYVAPEGTGDGSSWEAASGNLQSAIDASAPGDEIWVMAGTYKPTELIVSNKPRSAAFKLKSGVSLYGGFVGGETSREQRKLVADGKAWQLANPSVLSADDDVPDKWVREFDSGSSSRYSWTVTGNENNFYHCVVANEALTERTVVDGFTVKGGNADYHKPYAGGAAVYAIGWIELYNCIFTENHSKFKLEGTKDFHGGAVAILSAGGKARVENCLFSANKTSASYNSSFGGGLYIQQGSVKGCEFAGCVSLDSGGGVYLEESTIEDCRFDDCYGGSGGAVYNNAGTVSGIEVMNCRALLGGGVYNRGELSYARIVNCYADSEDYSDMGGRGGAILNEMGTALGCVAVNCSAFDGGGIYVSGGKVVNCTAQHNKVRNALSVATSNIQLKDGVDLISSVLNSIGNPDAEAANFVKPSSFEGWTTDAAKAAEAVAADWSLAPGSEFIDAGTITDGITETTDIAGNPRISGESIDVGAYESIAPAKPNIVITFATDDPVKFGTGGVDGTSFSVDWGNGELTEYAGAVYITGIPVNKVVKIYGNDLIILKAANCGIADLDISNAPVMGQVQVGGNQLKNLDVSKNIALTGLYCENNQIEALDVAALSRLRVLDCSDNKIEGVLDCSAMTALTKLTCFNNSISEIKLPQTTALTDIDCGMNRLAVIDVSTLPNLDVLSVNDNQLTTIDLSKNTMLTDLYCPGNKLEALDLKANTALTNISASENEIAMIDVSKNIEVTGLYLQNNRLTELDVANNTKLSWLNVENNQISSLNLAPLTQLRLLNVAGNRLAALDITASPFISTLHAGGNLLETLDVSKQTSLSWLTCSGNNIAELDLSKNSYLSWLECADNRIESLSVGHMSYLQKIIAGNNQLTALDLSKNSGIQGVMIEKNRMDASAINALIEALPDVSGVEIHDNNVDWAKQLNISDMPGTAGAHKSDAEAKGWIVTASTSGVADAGVGAMPSFAYDPVSATLNAFAEMKEIVVFATNGKMAIRRANTITVSLGELQAGAYVVRAVGVDNKQYTFKFVR